MAGLGEDQIIRILRKELGCDGRPAEDVEVVPRRGTGFTVAAVDTLVGSTDVPPGMKMPEIARKAVAACVSDFAAKGVRPEFGMVSLIVPAALSRKQVAGLAGGFRKASMEFGIRIVGGDTSGGMGLAIGVSLYGTADSIVGRGGAKSGDRIFVTGSFGNAAAGLHLMLHRKGSGREGADPKYRRAFCTPKPKLEFGIRSRRHVSSAMDSSDGLAKTLNEMARQSKKKFTVSRLPRDKALDSFAVKNGVSVEELVLFGGEEYETVFTVPEENVGAVRRIAKGSGARLVEIGGVLSGSGVVLHEDDVGVHRSIPDRGWSHQT